MGTAVLERVETIDDVIKCACGNLIHTEMKSELEDSLNCSSTMDLEESDEFQCDDCGVDYKLTMSVYKEIEVAWSQAVIVPKLVKDAQNEDFDLNQLGDLSIGDKVSLEDGSYIHTRYEYQVRNGVIASCFNAIVDENQISMDTELFPLHL